MPVGPLGHRSIAAEKEEKMKQGRKEMDEEGRVTRQSQISRGSRSQTEILATVDTSMIKRQDNTFSMVVTSTSSASTAENNTTRCYM